MNRDRPKIAAVILAGGAAKRLGLPKPLLLWRGKPFFEHLYQAANEARLSPILLVSGAYHEEINQAAVGFSLQIIYNPDWKEGQSTSVRAAVAALPEEIEAAIFLLADQPFITASLLTALAEAYIQTHAAVIAPFVGEQRGNPLLFSRTAFPDLAQLKGDQGGRAVLDQYPLHKIFWHDALILFDVDTPEDYQRLKEIERTLL